MSEITPERLDRIEESIRYSEDAIIDGLGFGQMIIERSDVRALVAALRAAWLHGKGERAASEVYRARLEECREENERLLALIARAGEFLKGYDTPPYRGANASADAEPGGA